MREILILVAVFVIGLVLFTILWGVGLNWCDAGVILTEAFCEGLQ